MVRLWRLRKTWAARGFGVRASQRWQLYVQSQHILKSRFRRALRKSSEGFEGSFFTKSLTSGSELPGHVSQSTPDEAGYLGAGYDRRRRFPSTPGKGCRSALFVAVALYSRSHDRARCTYQLSIRDIRIPDGFINLRMINKQEAAICKRRGHAGIVPFHDGWQQCKWCGVWQRRVIEEREDEPSEKDMAPVVQTDRKLDRALRRRKPVA
jgi:hypothetical protein